MFTQFTGLAILSVLIELLLVGVVLWLGFRFIKAHESLAKSLEKIEKALQKKRE